jgi:hypothetical protein
MYIYILPEKYAHIRLDYIRYIRRISAKTRFPACIGSYIRSCLVQEPLEISKGLPHFYWRHSAYGTPATNSSEGKFPSDGLFIFASHIGQTVIPFGDTPVS